MYGEFLNLVVNGDVKGTCVLVFGTSLGKETRLCQAVDFVTSHSENLLIKNYAEGLNSELFKKF